MKNLDSFFPFFVLCLKSLGLGDCVGSRLGLISVEWLGYIHSTRLILVPFFFAFEKLGIWWISSIELEISRDKNSDTRNRENRFKNDSNLRNNLGRWVGWPWIPLRVWLLMTDKVFSKSDHQHRQNDIDIYINVYQAERWEWMLGEKKNQSQ